jgi:hypothetical protein
LRQIETEVDAFPETHFFIRWQGHEHCPFNFWLGGGAESLKPEFLSKEISIREISICKKTLLMNLLSHRLLVLPT